MSELGEQFLHRKDPKLHTTTPIEHESVRQRIVRENELARRRRVGELNPQIPPISQKPTDKIGAFLGVIDRTHMGHEDDPRVIERIKGYYHKGHVIKPENIPQSYWNLQGEIAINEGRKQDLINAGVLIEENTTQNPDGTSAIRRIFAFPQDLKEQAVRIVIANQQQSLDKWVDYLTSDDALYPMWAKYWAFRSVVKMGKLEKTEDGKARFATREKNTVASFPVLNPRALANTIGAMSARLEAKGKTKKELKENQTTLNLSTTLSDEEYQKLLNTEDFSKLYAQFLSEIPEYSTHGLEETRGKWVKYSQGSNPIPLVKSLEGHPLEWCTADIDTARTQLEAGDFYVYYSFDQNGNPTIPRLAIRMEGARIAEPPRGIAHNQHLDPYILDVLEGKLKEFGREGEAFKKRASDMRLLTEIDKKTQTKTTLTSAELRFLYEIDGKIEGFGYDNQGRDPRIAELKGQRNPEEDMPIVFGCDKEQIARKASEIGPNTKAYVGLLEKGIFDKLAGIEHIYTSFPEGRIRIETLEVGGIDSKKLFKELEEKFQIKDELTWSQAREALNKIVAGSVQVDADTRELLSQLAEEQINISGYAFDMLKSANFTTLGKQQITLVKARVSDLGFKNGAATAEIIGTEKDIDDHGNQAPFTKGRMKELGLNLCLPEVGIYQRLKDTKQPLGDWYWIAMKQIFVRGGFPLVFVLGRGEDGLWLRDSWAYPDGWWSPGREFVFALRKSEPQALKHSGFFDKLFRH